MAGQKVEFRPSVVADGVAFIGVPMMIITENGNAKPGDDWVLYRLTDEGLGLYQEGAEFAANIMSIVGSVIEISRHGSKEEALEAMNRLSTKEKRRTLIRSILPGTHPRGTLKSDPAGSDSK